MPDLERKSLAPEARAPRAQRAGVQRNQADAGGGARSHGSSRGHVRGTPSHSNKRVFDTRFIFACMADAPVARIEGGA